MADLGLTHDRRSGKVEHPVARTRPVIAGHGAYQAPAHATVKAVSSEGHSWKAKGEAAHRFATGQ